MDKSKFKVAEELYDLRDNYPKHRLITAKDMVYLGARAEARIRKVSDKVS